MPNEPKPQNAATKMAVMPGSVGRIPAHGSITPEQVSQLVDSFYERVRSDYQLAPHFANHMSGPWSEHLPRMKAFWRSVLLKTGEYKGQPVPAHAKMKDVETKDFARWLMLFGVTVREIFASDAQPIVMAVAERIATSLWLATNPSPFASPPNWSELNAAQSAGENVAKPANTNGV